MRDKAVEPVVRDLGVRVEHDDVALAMEADAAVHRGGEALATRLLDDGHAARLRQFREEARHVRIVVAVVDHDDFVRRAHARAADAGDAAPQPFEVAVHGDDDVDGRHDRRSARRPRTAANGYRSHPRAVSRYASRARVSPCAAASRACASAARACSPCACTSADSRSASAASRRATAACAADCVDASAASSDAMPLLLHPAGFARARQRVHRHDEFGQALLGDRPRIDLVPRELAFARERARVVAPQRQRAVVEQRNRGQRGQRDSFGRADHDEVHRWRRRGLRGGRVAGDRVERNRAGRGFLRPQRRLREHALRVPALLRKPRRQQRREFGAVELAHVEVVLDVRAFVVDGAIRRRDHENAVGRQDAAELLDHRFLLEQMFDRLERHDEVRARCRQRQRGHRGLGELEVRPRVARARVRDRRGRDVDAGHARRALREQKAAVTLAAGGVDDPLAVREGCDRGVAMPVLVPDRTAHFRQEALAGERERGGGGGEGRQGEEGAGCAASADRRVNPEL